MTPRGFRAVARSAVVALLACAGLGRTADGPPLPPAEGAAAAAPVAAGASGSYGPEPEARLAPVEARLLESARERLGSSGVRPRGSPALSLAARALAARAAAGDAAPLAGAAIRAALAGALSYDAAPAAYLVRARADAAPAAMAELLRPSSATHAGAGAVERDGSLFAVVLASERKARLDPFPRAVAPGTTAVLAGELAAGLSDPQVFVRDPGGGVREVEASGRRRFQARVSFPTGGRYTVEVVARGTAETEVAALLRVSAGGATLDAEPAAALAPDLPDDGAAEAAVLQAINVVRRSRGLSTLASDDVLAGIARTHSAAMRAKGRVAHVLPGTGSVGERLRAAAVPYRRGFENVARGESAMAAHAAVEESPAHLANLLRPEARRAGVGLARGRLASGDPVVYLTEILVEPPDDSRASALTPDARVREALWRERARLGRPPLTADAALDALAREAAASMRARDELGADAIAARAVSAARSVAAVDVFVVSAPGEATRSRNLPDARFRRVGVGVVGGDSRRFGAGRLFIAVVYAD